MKYLVMALAVVLLGSCASTVDEDKIAYAKACPPIKPIESTQSLKDYTLNLIDVYKTCAEFKK